MVNQFEAILEASRHQEPINLKVTNAFGVRVDIPVGAAKMPHRPPLNVLHYPVEVARHAVPFVWHGEQNEQQVSNSQNQQRTKQAHKQELRERL